MSRTNEQLSKRPELVIHIHTLLGDFSCRKFVYLPRPLGQTLLCLYSLLMLHVWSMQAHIKLVLLQAMQQLWFKENLFCGHITALLAFVCIPVPRMGGPVHKMKISFQRKSKFSTWDIVSWNYFLKHYQYALQGEKNPHTLETLTMQDNIKNMEKHR